MDEINDSWLTEYLPKYELLGKYITFILENLLQQKGIDYLSVSYRTKTKDGVYEKIERKKYKKPKAELMDFSGVRVILYFESDIDKVCALIADAFNIDSEHSVDNEKRLSKDKIGYRSIHYVCDIGSKRKDLAEYEYISGLKCEIQVRTMLQHAWAELTHDRNYKLGVNLPLAIERKINLYSGMLELADQGFSEIINSIVKYQADLKGEDLINSESNQIDTLSIVEFSRQIASELGITLIELNSNKYKFLDDLIDEIKFLGIKNFQELKSIIPDNYSKVFLEVEEESNVLGFVRDLLLIKDFRRLAQFPGLSWGLLNNDYDQNERRDRIEYFANFMSLDDAEELVATFSENVD